MPVALTRTVWKSVGKSSVLKKVSKRPKGIMDGILPRAYSSAQQASGIRYCLATPHFIQCWSPGVYTSRFRLPASKAHCSTVSSVCVCVCVLCV
jgi:hypothetical protein